MYHGPELPPVEITPAGEITVASVYERYKSFHARGYTSHHWSFTPPSVAELLKAQTTFLSATDKPATFVKVDDGLHYCTVKVSRERVEKIWIPARATPLIVRLMITAHASAAGHRGISSTLDNLSQFHWPSMEEHVKEFCRSCLLCHCTKGGRVIPRPLGHQLVPTEPNEIIQFDWMYMLPNKNNALHDYVYLLVIKDVYSRFVELYPSAHADALNTAIALQRWFSRYGVVKKWISDQGSHFINNLMMELASMLGVDHHPVVAYSPWANGGVERANKEILLLIRALLVDAGAPPDQWPYFLAPLQDILVSQNQDGLSKNCARKVFLNLERSNPVTSFFHPVLKKSLPIDVSKYADRIDAVTDAVAKMNDEVDEARAKRNAINKRYHDQRAVVINFDIGDYVLHANTYKVNYPKLSVVWKGPYRIIDRVHPWVFEIQDILTPKKKIPVVHATRLKYYSDQFLDLDDILEESRANQDLCDMKVEAIVGHRYVKATLLYSFDVKWFGFSELENSWETASYLLSISPDILIAYVDSLPAGRHKKTLLDLIAQYDA